MKNKIKSIVATVLVAGSLSGCGVYSKFESPTDIVEFDELYSYIEASNDTTNMSNIEWRELFDDEYLHTLIERALEGNTDLNVARLNVEQADIAVKVAKKAFLPSLNFNPSYSVSTFDGVKTSSYSVSMAASWEVDIFGKLRNAKRESLAALEQSSAYRQYIMTQLISTITSSYYSLLLLDEQLDITLRTAQNWEANTIALEALMKAGRINESSVLQSQANMIALEGSVLTLKQQICELESSISTLIAQPTKTIERGSFTNVEIPTDISVGVPIQLLSNRPDVKAAEWSLSQMFYATGEARSSLYPSLTLSGSAGYTNSGSVVSNPGDMLYSATASLLQPIFNRGTLRAQLKISESQQEQARLEFKQVILDAAAEVNMALVGLQSAEAQLVVDEAQIEVLRRAVQSSELLMKHGNVNSLEVLTAQLSLLQGELSYSANKYSKIQSVIDLYRALGGGR